MYGFQTQKLSTCRFQKGAGLIEVMVSLLILGVGLLGVLGLQSQGLNSNQRALFVTEAQLLAQDMADRIMAFGNIPTGDNTGGYGGTNTDNAPNVSCDSGCGEKRARNYDKTEWARLVKASSLPRARGEVKWEDPFYTIEVMWDQERDDSGDPIECEAQNCYRMELRL